MSVSGMLMASGSGMSQWPWDCSKCRPNQSETSLGSVSVTWVAIIPNVHISWPMAICRSWRSETVVEDDEDEVSTAVTADNAGERTVETVAWDVLSVSVDITLAAALTTVSTLDGLEVNVEMPSSDVSPEVLDPKNRSAVFKASSGDETVDGPHTLYTELRYSSKGSCGCSASEVNAQLASGILKDWLDSGVRPEEPVDETREWSPAYRSGG